MTALLVEKMAKKNSAGDPLAAVSKLIDRFQSDKDAREEKAKADGRNPQSLVIVADTVLKNLVQDVTRLAMKLTGNRRLPEGVIVAMVAEKPLIQLKEYLEEILRNDGG